MGQQHRRRSTSVGVAALFALLLSACQSTGDGESRTGERGTDGRAGAASESGEQPDFDPITLAFAGDIHFEGVLADLPARPRSTLGPMSSTLRQADLSMVNLESALTTTDDQAAKELEDSDNRYWFRSGPGALGVMERSGVDVVTLANNHGGDYGAAGLRDSLRIAERSPVAVVGIGRDDVAAYTPYRTTIKGTDVAVLAADSSPRESEDPIWSAQPGTGVGMAAARVPSAPQLIRAVEDADRTSDLVVVNLHWGDENVGCPTRLQRGLAESLAEAGADVVVGSHAHVLLGAGMLDDTYVSYGLGNFLWYHGRTSETGVLKLRVGGGPDGEVLGQQWKPGEIPLDGGQPQPLAGAAARDAAADWRSLRGCTDLAPGPRASSDDDAQDDAQDDTQAGGSEESDGGTSDDGATGSLPAYRSEVSEIGPAIARKMRGVSYDADTCPVPLSDLRHLSMSYVGFDGEAHQGTMVVDADVAADVTGLFGTLYEQRFPIASMRLIDAFGGDDDASMAANNTSGFNCRTVAGSDSFSQHAFGRAIDINPVQNPYVVGGDVRPPAGSRFVDVDRGPGPRSPRGVIREGDPVFEAFDRLGWTWGGYFSEPDYQHWTAP